MRSSADTPFAVTSSLWENPIAVARHQLSKTSDGFLLEKPQNRPVNMRNYWSPAYWVRSVESNEANQSTRYTDWQSTDEYNRIWKDFCNKEASLQEQHRFRPGKVAEETFVGLRSEYSGSYLPKLDDLPFTNSAYGRTVGGHTVPTVPGKGPGLGRSQSTPSIPQAMKSRRVTFSHSRARQRPSQADMRTTRSGNGSFRRWRDE